MISKIANSVAGYYSRKGVIPDEDVETYSYGFELVISSAINLSCVMAAAVVFGVVYQALAFMLSFVLLRAFGGGYHARTHRGCILAFFILFIIFAYTLRYLPADVTAVFTLASVWLSLVIVLLAAPVEAENKPLSAAKRVRLRRICILVATIYVIAATLMTLLLRQNNDIFAFAAAGQFAGSASIAFAAVRHRAKKSHEK